MPSVIFIERWCPVPAFSGFLERWRVGHQGSMMFQYFFSPFFGWRVAKQHGLIPEESRRAPPITSWWSLSLLDGWCWTMDLQRMWYVRPIYGVSDEAESFSLWDDGWLQECWEYVEVTNDLDHRSTCKCWFWLDPVERMNLYETVQMKFCELPPFFRHLTDIVIMIRFHRFSRFPPGMFHPFSTQSRQPGVVVWAAPEQQKAWDRPGTLLFAVKLFHQPGVWSAGWGGWRVVGSLVVESLTDSQPFQWRQSLRFRQMWWCL